MSRKKEGSMISLKLDAIIKERLEHYCEETRMKKTAAIEKALTMMLDDYDKMQQSIKE